MLRSFRDGFRVLVGLLEDIRHALAALPVDGGSSPSGEALAQLDDRVTAMETRAAIWEAEVEGAMLKAEGKHRAARAAEERARALAKKAGDEDDEDEPLDRLRLANGEAGGAEGMPTVRPDLEAGLQPSRKNRARLLKYGIRG